MKNLHPYIQYTFHILLNLKNKVLLNIFLQIIFVLLLTNIIDYTYCMTNDNDAISIHSDDIQQNSEISSVFEYDELYIEHCVEPHLENLLEKYNRQFIENTDITSITPVERSLGPLFEYLKTEHPDYSRNFTNFDNQPLSEKIKDLQHAYFTESIEKAVLRDCLEKQTDQLLRRQETLLEAKETIRELTQENLDLKNQLNELIKAHKK